MKTILIALTASFVAATGVAVAQDTGALPRPPMMRADANGDGVVTRQEMMDDAGRRFDRLDTNHDGRLDATEMAAMRGGRGGMGRPGRFGGDVPPPPAPPQQ